MMGKSFGKKNDGTYEFKDVKTLPNGAGYLYLREAFKKTIEGFAEFCDTLILTGHVSDKQVEKDGKEVYELDIALTGKLKTIIGAQADAIGYVYRKGNKTMISFKGGQEAIVESRPAHLRGKEILIAESQGEGEETVITTYWDKIFKDL